jgi:competence protein ComEA
MRKHFIGSYFDISKKERTGTVALLVIVAVCIILPFITPLFISTKTYSHSEFEEQIAALKIKPADSTGRYRNKWDDDGNDYQPYNEPAARKYTGSSPQEWKGELFYFDPNTLEEAGWQKLGVKDKTIATIKNYVSKGGKFYKPDDIKKIWGLSEAVADKLIPYIQIEKKETGDNERYTPTERTSFEKKTYTAPLVDINTADTTAFIALPGIGSKLAQRIVTFRDKLGGFYTIEQVGETFGLPDSVFQKIKPRLSLNNAAVKQININTATVDELKAHPYLRYAVGNAIVQYRSQHGNFDSVNDLKKIAAITGDIFSKSFPYLKVN